MKNKELNELFGLPNQTINDWERGKSGEGKTRLLLVLKALDYAVVKNFIDSQKELSLQPK